MPKRRRATRASTILVIAIAFSSFPVVAEAAPRTSSRDIIPPVIAITAPLPGSTVSGVVTVSGTAADNDRVRKVSVAVDGATPTAATGTIAWSAILDVSSLATGAHAITAVATDRAGNTAKIGISVSIASPLPPPPSPSPSPTPSPSVSPAPTVSPTPTPISTPGSVVTPEGVTITVDTASGWTADRVYQILKANALELSTIGPSLTVAVQDAVASATAASAQCCTAGRYTSFQAVVYLDARSGSVFNLTPDAIIAHEFGHVWTLYHLWISQSGDWSSYVQARGIASDSRLDSSYVWSKREIAAEDYRLLFGTAAAVSEQPQPMNTDITDPRNVPGLRDFMLGYWSVSH